MDAYSHIVKFERNLRLERRKRLILDIHFYLIDHPEILRYIERGRWFHRAA